MKRFAVILLTAVIAVCLAGCDKAVEDPDHNYRVTGHFADWGSNYDANFMMTNVSRSDARIKDIKDALKDASYIYLYEYDSNLVSPAGWNVEYPGMNISQDGRFAVKFIRLLTGSNDFDMWMPSAEAGGMRNLSPDTLYVPKNRSDEERDAAKDGLGSNNDNPVLLKGAQTYYIVFAVFKNRDSDGLIRGMGAVVKP